MPATPFHIGPGVLVCLVLGPGACGAALAGSLLPDVEPGAVILLGLDARLHGPLHSLPAALLLGSLVGVLGSALWRRLTGLSVGLGSSLVAGTLGWSVHVFLDSFLYSDIQPLWPLAEWNPLLGLLGPYTVLVVYMVSGLLSLWGLYFLASLSRVPRSR